MAKRFGRNQKRKMRESIARLEHQLHEREMLSARNDKIVRDTAEVLGNYFITLPPKSWEVRYLEELASGYWVIPKFNRLPINLIENVSMTQPTEFMQMALPILRESEYRDDLSGVTHIVFKYGGHDVGYAFSESVFYTAPKEFLVREIAQSMADLMVSQMNSVGQKPALSR